MRATPIAILATLVVSAQSGFASESFELALLTPPRNILRSGQHPYLERVVTQPASKKTWSILAPSQEDGAALSFSPKVNFDRLLQRLPHIGLITGIKISLDTHF